MDYIPIYLLIGIAIFCIFGIFIYLSVRKKSVLDNNGETIIDQYINYVQTTINHSRAKITVSQYIMIQIGFPLGLAVVAFFISSDRTLMLIFILLGCFAPSTALRLISGDRRRKFEDEFVRALAQMASSLHSGMTIEQATESVANCELLTDDIRDDFRTISSQIKLGASISDAFFDYAKKTGSDDCADVATAITIMTDVGGDAGVAVEKLQKNIEDRLQYRKQRESMMTESNMIALFADIVPILILAGTYILMPGTIQAYFESITMTIVFIVIIVVLIVGSVVVHKMLDNKEDIN